MKKRLQQILACLVLCAVLAGGLTLSASAAQFSDVPASSWAADAIGRCVDMKFFQGETATRFGMGHEMKRSAFAVVLCRFFGWETAAPTQATYKDVPLDAWYAGAVEAAYAHGALTDQSDSFRPDDPITREELAVMLVRALGYGTIAGLVQDLPMPFTDVTTNVGYTTMAYDLGLVGGTTSTTFSPEKTATREQVAVILMRLYDKLHSAAPGKVGIVSSAEGLGSLEGYEAVAITGGRLAFAAGQARVNGPSEERSGEMCAAAACAAAVPAACPSAMQGGITRMAPAASDVADTLRPATSRFSTFRGTRQR